MQIESVRIENFKGYAYADIPFGPGVTAILGPNGAGKSSILEAIKYALFDLCSGTVSDLLREGTNSGNVEVSLRVGEQVYLVERRFNAKGTTRYRVYASVSPESDILAEGVKGVQLWLRDSLNISPDLDMGTLFENTAGVPQGMITAAFALPSGPRKLVFDPLLQVEDFRKASDNLRPTIGQLKDLASVQRADSARLEGMQEGLPALQAEEWQLETEMLSLDLALCKDRNLLGAAERKLLVFDEAQKRAEDTAKQAEVAKTHLEAHEHVVAATGESLMVSVVAKQIMTDTVAEHCAYCYSDAELQRLEPKRTLRDTLLRRMSEAELAMAQHTAALAAEGIYRREAEQAAAHVAEVQKGLAEAFKLATLMEDLEPDIGRSRALLEDIVQKMAFLQVNANMLCEQNDMLSDSTIAECPTCGTELTEEHRGCLLAENTDKLNRHREGLERLGASQGATFVELQRREAEQKAHRVTLRSLPSAIELARARKELQQRLDVLVKAEAQVLSTYKGEATEEGYIERIKQDLNEYAGLDVLLASHQAARDENQRGHDRYVSNLALAESHDKREEAHAEALTELGRLQRWVTSAKVTADMHRAAYNEEAHGATKRQADTYLADIVAGEAKLTLKGERLNVVRKDLAVLEAIEGKRVALAEALALTEKTQETLQWARGLLREAGPHVTRRVVRQVSQHASELYAELTGDLDKRLDWSEDYAASLQVGPYTRNFSSQLSGGEQMSVALALRLALLREMSGIDVAFFDEPTADLDAFRRESLAERISDVKGLSQVFVISHDDTFESSAENTIRVVSEEGASHVSTTE